MSSKSKKKCASGKVLKPSGKCVIERKKSKPVKKTLTNKQKNMIDLTKCATKYCNNKNNNKKLNKILNDINKDIEKCIKLKSLKCIKKSETIRSNEIKAILNNINKCIESKCKKILSKKDLKEYNKEMLKIKRKCSKKNGLEYMNCLNNEEINSKVLKIYKL